VGIKTTAPHPSVILNIQSADKGVLTPKVSLINLAIASPFNSPADGLLVYDTNNTIGADTNASVFYYWMVTS